MSEQIYKREISLRRHEFLLVVISSFCLAVFFGWIDYETKSLVHLFTAEWGNIAMLVNSTMFFSLVGTGVWLLCKWIVRF